MNETKLPTFLIIGAMKAGTTTLYRDLLANKSIYFPDDKEPEMLSTDFILTSGGLQDFANLYKKASAHQARGDASTGYSKLPTIPGVPDRAFEVLGKNLKIIYIVRHPVARIRSHHHHYLVRGLAGSDINYAVRTNPEYVAYSRYAMQLQPWIERFGVDHVLAIGLEEYAANRLTTMAKVFSFLEVPDIVQSSWDGSQVFNRTEAQPVLSDFWRSICGNRLYRTYVRPHIGTELRRRLQSAVVPKAHERAGDLDSDTLDYLVAHLEGDTAMFQDMVGWSSEFRWDLTSINAATR